MLCDYHSFRPVLQGAAAQRHRGEKHEAIVLLILDTTQHFKNKGSSHIKQKKDDAGCLHTHTPLTSTKTPPFVVTAGLHAIVIPLVVVLRHVADHRAELVERAVGLLDEVGVDARTKNVHIVCETLGNLLRSQLNTKTVSRYDGGGGGCLFTC